MAGEADQRMQMVRKFHRNSENTTSFSIFKDAKRYTNEIGFKLDINEEMVSLYETETGEQVASDYVTFSKVVKSKINTIKYQEIISSTWQGVNVAHRLNDVNVMKTYFNWLSKWKSCPTSVVQEFYLLFYQLLPTKQYRLIRTKEILDDTICRICNTSQQESVKHLISNCSEFAKQVYITRHNNALKCFVWPLLKMLGLTQKCPVWYANDKVDAYYVNEKAKFWWDIPEYTERDTEIEHPQRPDGKVMINNENSKKIFLIEMTVPWIENRDEKFEYKCRKYNNILANLRFENPGYDVDQITLVMDVFGGFGKDLLKNIKKVITVEQDVKSIVNNMQKSVISSCANLSRTFKIRTKVQ